MFRDTYEELRDARPGIAAKSEKRARKLLFVDALIDTEGIPREPIALHPCGVTVFDFAAVDAVCQWHYRPASPSGVPVPVFLAVAVSFSLRWQCLLREGGGTWLEATRVGTPAAT